MGLFDIDRPSMAYHPRRGVKFSSEEIKALSIAVGVLTICFAVAFSSSGILDLIGRFKNDNISIGFFILILGVSFISVLTAFVFHEIGHKIAANHYGYPAAFSYSKQGLMFTAFISLLFGILFAAPGAVLIYGRPTRKENGIISLAGPLTNLLIGIIFAGLFIFSVILSEIIGLGEILSFVFSGVASINIFIGAFNMIPVGIFDGAKVLRWNKIVYFILLAFYLPAIIFFFFINFMGSG
jgi:Zn-dependent protease